VQDYAQAAIVAADDARLAAERVSYDSPKGKINGYLVRGKALGKRPVVIVIHENRGLNPHIEDVARRLAVEGYLALAPDLLSVNGGTPPEENKARELHAKTEREDMIAAALAAIPFMQKHAEAAGKVGAVGFCFGGGVVNRMAAGSPDLAAAVPYYGGDQGTACADGFGRSAYPSYVRVNYAEGRLSRRPARVAAAPESPPRAGSPPSSRPP
jgi:carboxymethylenebutenolidase